MYLLVDRVREATSHRIDGGSGGGHNDDVRPEHLDIRRDAAPTATLCVRTRGTEVAGIVWQLFAVQLQGSLSSRAAVVVDGHYGDEVFSDRFSY